MHILDVDLHCSFQGRKLIGLSYRRFISNIGCSLTNLPLLFGDSQAGHDESTNDLDVSGLKPIGLTNRGYLFLCIGTGSRSVSM
jgi:hypothetical protein